MSRAARPAKVGRSFLQGVDTGRDAPHGKSLLAEVLPDMKTLLHPQKNQWEFLVILTESWISPKAPQKSLEGLSLKREDGKRQSLSHGLCGLCCVKSARI